MKVYRESDFTEWFPPSTVPGQAGVYETSNKNPIKYPGQNTGFQDWNPIGAYYGLRQITPNYADRNGIHISVFQNVWWRGLKEQQK
jgi:hypothetical protein